MADLILVCTREREGDGMRRDLEVAAALLPPAGVQARPPLVVGSGGVTAVVVSPSQDGSSAREGGVRVGGFIGPPGEWWRVGSPAPDGTYVLARWDAGTVEVLDDIVGSRTVWYAMDEQRLVVSTSQRALAAVLGDVVLDPRAPAWLLSSGTLGPLGRGTRASARFRPTLVSSWTGAPGD